jgi:hypothetical protein
VYVVLAAVPLSENAQPGGTVLAVPVLARVSKFSVYAEMPDTETQVWAGAKPQITKAQSTEPRITFSSEVSAYAGPSVE